MAVSHQWFIQWSAPSMIFADLTSKYNNVNNWNHLDSKLSDPQAFRNGDDYNYQTSENDRQQLHLNNYKDATKKFSFNGKLQSNYSHNVTELVPFLRI